MIFYPHFVYEALVTAFTAWKEDTHYLFLDDGIVFRCGNKNLLPGRIKRSEKYESVAVKNLYPIGEGSGYTGGITSSAIDAIKAVEVSLSNYLYRYQ